MKIEYGKNVDTMYTRLMGNTERNQWNFGKDVVLRSFDKLRTRLIHITQLRERRMVYKDTLSRCLMYPATIASYDATRCNQN